MKNETVATTTVNQRAESLVVKLQACKKQLKNQMNAKRGNLLFQVCGKALLFGYDCRIQRVKSKAGLD